MQEGSVARLYPIATSAEPSRAHGRGERDPGEIRRARYALGTPINANGGVKVLS